MITYIQSITPVRSSYTMAIVTGMVLFFTAACSNLTGRYGHLPNKFDTGHNPFGMNNSNHPANAIGVRLNNAGNTVGNTGLHLAVIDDNLQNIVTLLREPSTNVNARNASGNTALHLAVAHNHLESLLFLMLFGISTIDINVQNEAGNTPLHLAAHSGRRSIVEILLGRPDVDVNVRNANGLTPMDLAAEPHHLAVVRRLQ
ncbi:Ankyrin repeats-containing protein [Cardinium endosymbiont cBtQ1 of Bemisia tabaci]|nr:Ankyrin repeats-containing protein [Cardinium endosymbiont cBtQ1 of Bemisia tabaci]